MEISFKEVDVAKLNLQPGDTLTVTIKSNDVDYNKLGRFRENIQDFFPNNPVLIFSVSENEEVRFSITGQVAQGCSTTSHCTDCNCGKKEQVESQ